MGDYTQITHMLSLISKWYTKILTKIQQNTVDNECTEVQNPRYKDVTLNAYTSA